MLTALEGCEGYAAALRALVAAVESQWEDDTLLPPELAALLSALDGAVPLAEELDEAAA
jgi:hypothetical protein